MADTMGVTRTPHMYSPTVYVTRMRSVALKMVSTLGHYLKAFRSSRMENIGDGATKTSLTNTGNYHIQSVHEVASRVASPHVKDAPS
ncbi:hypothetical protein V6N11_046704 [Hibiscus sabdariffa]|uniref:Uncharacterized protein n=2 Tax=Hibiscus sabdariffa TaxID=183260 RepID=A0ABR1Z6P7_9ROSI